MDRKTKRWLLIHYFDFDLGVLMRTQIINLDDSKRAYFIIFETLITNPVSQFVVNPLKKFILTSFMRFL